MNKKESGSVLIFIIIALVVLLIGVLGFVVWQSLTVQDTDDDKADTASSIIEPQEEQNNFDEYENSIIGIKFTYPKGWVSLSCPDRPKVVYFATDKRGAPEEQLCGGGSDFPVQMTFSSSSTNGINMEWFLALEKNDVTIDGQAGFKSTVTTDGSGIRPQGYEYTYYLIDDASTNTTRQFTYIKPPVSDDATLDTSEASLEAFEDLVEHRLEFI